MNIKFKRVKRSHVPAAKPFEVKLSPSTPVGKTYTIIIEVLYTFKTTYGTSVNRFV